jgi:hypothetical protein
LILEELPRGESCACEETCVCLQSKDGKVEVIPIPDLHTSQEEADTSRIMLHTQHAGENDDKAIIVNLLILMLWYYF